MSYVFDTLSNIWDKHVRPAVIVVKGEMFTMHFEAVLQEMHDANHRLKDAVNHDLQVNRAVRELVEQVKIMEAAAAGKVPDCPRCSCPTKPDGEKAYACGYCKFKLRWVL